MIVCSIILKKWILSYFTLNYNSIYPRKYSSEAESESDRSFTTAKIRDRILQPCMKPLCKKIKIYIYDWSILFSKRTGVEKDPKDRWVSDEADKRDLGNGKIKRNEPCSRCKYSR